MLKNRKYLFIGLASGIILTLAGTWGTNMLAATGVLSGDGTTIAPSSKVAEKKVETIESLIHKYYLYDVPNDNLTDSMYAGLVDGIADPYSCYYTKAEYESVNESTEGHYQGIGVVMIQDKDTNAVTVAHCYEGSPAQIAGVKDGDIIYMIDDVLVDKQKLTDVSAKIKTNGKQTVHLSLIREGQNDYVEVDVVKGDIEIPVVDNKMLEDQIGYIGIHQFTGATTNQLEKALTELKEQGMKRLVIDLRDNPGGLLSGVCNSLDLIMPKGLLVYTEDKYGNKSEYQSEGKTPLDLPLVVLTNKNSASASEIFAGAVKDRNVGTLVGTTTFGKGIVQKIFNLSDGSVVKLTISSYYTPSGINIHGTGIEPDVEIENPEFVEDQEFQDLQLEKAIEVVKSRIS